MDQPLTQAQIDEIVRHAFHEAWSSAHGLPDYDKKAWGYVQRFLDPAYKNQRPITGIKPGPDGKLRLGRGNIVIDMPHQKS